MACSPSPPEPSARGSEAGTRREVGPRAAVARRETLTHAGSRPPAPSFVVRSIRCERTDARERSVTHCRSVVWSPESREFHTAARPAAMRGPPPAPAAPGRRRCESHSRAPGTSTLAGDFPQLGGAGRRWLRTIS